jgi:hypothetical protein
MKKGRLGTQFGRREPGQVQQESDGSRSTRRTRLRSQTPTADHDSRARSPCTLAHDALLAFTDRRAYHHSIERFAGLRRRLDDSDSGLSRLRG